MANPTRDYATISYAITKPGMVSLKVYDGTGRLVETLVNNTQEAGIQTVTWDAQNVANGVYFLQLEAENQTAVHKLILVK
jgi:flagellar hook assembly protein FlgD